MVELQQRKHASGWQRQRSAPYASFARQCAPHARFCLRRNCRPFQLPTLLFDRGEDQQGYGPQQALQSATVDALIRRIFLLRAPHLRKGNLMP